MLNPQMMQQMPDVPSPQELWKNEKNKYRHWIILFFIGIVTLSVLSLLVIIFNAINIDQIVEKNKEGLSKNGFTGVINEAEIQKSIIWKQFVPRGLSVVSLFVGMFLFVKTTVIAYKKHSFKYISQWSTFVVGIAAFFSAYSLFSLIWNFGYSTDYIVDTPSGIYTLSYYIASILIWLLISAPLGRIRRLFIVSERVQQYKEMQKNPQFQAAQSQFQEAIQKMAQTQSGAFGPTPAGATVNPQNNQATTVQPNKPEISPEEKKLKNMPVSDLKEVAKELSISGHSKMNKEELIKAILRVTNKENK